MPIVEAHTSVVEYPLARLGVNLHKNIVKLNAEEALTAQNCIWRNGIVKRGGSAKFETDEVATGKKITGLHRFYYSTASKQLLASSGTVVRYHDGATWQDAITGLTDGSQVHMTTWLDKAYVANVDDAPNTWDGSSSAAIGAAPTDTRMFLPYQDRLLSITGGDLTWSDSFDDTGWGSIAEIGVRPDTQLFGMVYHSATNVDAGYEAKILLAGANGMYVFSATDLRWPATTGDYTIFPLATTIGCNAPRTMQWTPFGTIYLGIDKQLYLLPFNSVAPIPIGTKIHSTHVGIEGIENIPSGQLANACAIYHDGYYKLSVAQSAQTTNNVQFWLDVKRIQQDEDGLWGPWYGPMKGTEISVFATQNGNGDSGELMGGESNATTGSFVYTMDDDTLFADSGTAIQIFYQTLYHPLTGNDFLNKDVHRVEFELRDVLGTVNIDFFDINGTLKTGDTISLSGQAIYWDDAYWGDEYWSSSIPTRSVVNITPAIQPRRLSILVKNSTDNDTFELYAIRAEVKEQSLIFDD